jgi:hypothetical protein
LYTVPIASSSSGVASSKTEAVVRINRSGGGGRSYCRDMWLVEVTTATYELEEREFAVPKYMSIMHVPLETLQYLFTMQFAFACSFVSSVGVSLKTKSKNTHMCQNIHAIR